MKKYQFDSNPAAAISFLIQQAAHIEQEVYKVEYPQYKSSLLIDIDRSAPDWTKSVIFRMSDVRGKLGWLGDQSNDINTVDIGRDMGTHTITTGALGYTYSVQELQTAAMMGENLDSERAQAVRDVTEQSLDVLYLLGDDEVGMKGLFNQENITKTSDGTTKNLIATAISDNKPEDIIKIFGDLYNKVYIDQTNTIHKPTNFTVPTTQFALLNQNFCNFGNASNISYMQALKISYPDMIFEDSLQLKGIGANASDRIVCHKKDIRVVKAHEPMKLRFLAPATADNIRFTVPSMTRSGGVEVRIPAAMCYADGV